MQNRREAQKYFDQGLALRSAGKHRQAMIKYSKAILLDPDLYEAYFRWGYALFYDAKPAEEAEKYKRAIVINPRYASAHYNLGVALTDQSKYEEAIKRFEKSISYSYQLSKSYNNMAFALYSLMKYDEAIQTYMKAIYRDPNYTMAYINWGLTLYHKGEKAKATQAFIIGIKTMNTAIRLKEVIELYNVQYAIAQKQLTDNTITMSQNFLKTKIEAIEEILSLLTTNPENLDKQLYPIDILKSQPESAKQEESKQETFYQVKLLPEDPFLQGYYNFITKSFAAMLKNAFSVTGIQLQEKNPYISKAVLEMTYLFPSFIEKIAFFDSISVMKEANLNELSTTNQLKIRVKNQKYQAFVRHFVSLNDFQCIIELVAFKLIFFRKEELLQGGEVSDGLPPLQRDDSEILEMFAHDDANSRSRKYGLLDLNAVVLLCFLEGVEVPEYKSIAEKFENISEAIFLQVKKLNGNADEKTKQME